MQEKFNSSDGMPRSKFKKIQRQIYGDLAPSKLADPENPSKLFKLPYT